MTMVAFSFFVHILYFQKFLQWTYYSYTWKKEYAFFKKQRRCLKDICNWGTRWWGHKRSYEVLYVHTYTVTKKKKKQAKKKKKERKLSMFCHSCGLERKLNYRKFLLSDCIFKKSLTMNLSWGCICVRLGAWFAA